MEVRFAIDDFGTGYSSLSHLRHFPLQTLKIDRAFVGRLSKGDTGSAGIVTAVASLGRSLELEVTAEGVESEDQLAFLRSLGCTNAQGYLFSRPLPAETLTKLLQEKGRVSLHPVIAEGADPETAPRHVAGLQNLAAEVSEKTAGKVPVVVSTLTNPKSAWKNRVQPANSLQSKCFVSRAMTGSELVAVPIFRSCTTFATGC